MTGGHQHGRRLLGRLAAAALLAALTLPASTHAHDIPTRVTLHSFVKPEPGRLTVLLRVPMDALGEIRFPLRGPGYLQFSEAQPALRDAARVYLVDSLLFYANGRRLDNPTLAAARVSRPSNREFVSYERALANVLSPPLADNVDLFWRQGLLDLLIHYPIPSADADFAIHPNVGQLAGETRTALRFILPDGTERAFHFTGNPGVVELDPRWHQAVLRFMTMGLDHILAGWDHLLFLFCLVIPLRSLRGLIPVVTSFTIAHSITLTAAVMGLAPKALWFPPLIETLIALSIIYMAFENIVGRSLRNRWLVTFGFGLVHGFGFSFLFSDTLQFAGGHLFSSLLAFNIGVEIGQLLVLALVIPLLKLLFRFVDARVGTILLSALVAHSAWHWMSERGAALGEYSFQLPIIDALFFAALLRWFMLLIVSGIALWLLAELSRRLAVSDLMSDDSGESGGRNGSAQGRQ